MMETWLIYAIISVFAAGLYSFMAKVAAERSYNTSLMMIYSYSFATILSGIYCLYYKVQVIDLYLILLFAAGNSLFYFGSTVSRVKSMKYIDTVIFFPIYKTVGPIIITIVSFFYFAESLDSKELLGILLGITVPLLLITKDETNIQKNLKKGIILVVATALLTSCAAVFTKQIPLHNLNVDAYVFISMLMGAIFGKISYKFIQTGAQQKNMNTKGLLLFAVVLGSIHLITITTFTRALTGNLAVVFTINSFSILIPIVLSIFFYKEHFNFKKGFVIFLSVLSILLFI